MLEEYKVRGRSGSLRLKVDAVDPANPTPVDEIKLVKRKKGRSRTGISILPYYRVLERSIRDSIGPSPLLGLLSCVQVIAPALQSHP
jgi:hypothetical protein